LPVALELEEANWLQPHLRLQPDLLDLLGDYQTLLMLTAMFLIAHSH
jgi:hypothetical protein